jgi:hypothetical protein
MTPDELKLETLNKLFEYEKISRELDSCTNIDLLRNICKCYVKLYMKQEEVISSLNVPGLNN